MAIMKFHPYFYPTLHPKLRSNKELALLGVKFNGSFLFKASDELKNDEDVVIEAVKQNVNVYPYCSLNLKKSKNFYFKLNANKKFFDDYDLMLDACKESRENFIYATEKLRSNMDLAKVAISEYPQAFSAVLNKTDEISIFAIEKSGLNLKYCSDKIKNDRNIVKNAIEKLGDSFIHASEKLRDDEKLARIAIEKSPFLFKFVSKRLKNLEELSRFAIKLQSENIKYTTCEKIKNEKDL